MNYDVFLSCKSEDYKIAEEVYQYLTDNGFHVFLSSKELRRMKDSEYMDAISDALDSAYHLIVLSSSASNIKSKWVKFEWSSFLNEVLSERKKGQIMTLVNNIFVAELPIQLRHYEMFHLDDYKERILSYIETPDYIQRRLEAEERKKMEAERRRIEEEKMEPKLYDVFISYSWNDVDVAKEIFEAIINAGLKCCFDKETFHGGADFPKVTAANICKSDVFLYLGSKSSFSSGWAPDEVAFAKSRKKREKLLYYSIDNNKMPDWLDLAFAASNRRNIYEHPYRSVLIEDIRKMLGDSSEKVISGTSQYSLSNKEFPLLNELKLRAEQGAYREEELYKSANKLLGSIIPSYDYGKDVEQFVIQLLGENRICSTGKFPLPTRDIFLLCVSIRLYLCKKNLLEQNRELIHSDDLWNDIISLCCQSTNEGSGIKSSRHSDNSYSYAFVSDILCLVKTIYGYREKTWVNISNREHVIVELAEDKSIRFSSYCKDPNDYYLMENHVNEVKQVINDLYCKTENFKQCYQLLFKVYPAELSITYDDTKYKIKDGTQITLDQANILKLLTGVNLYQNPYACLRELYQNSLDACRRRLCAIDNRINRGRIAFGIKKDELQGTYLYCYDNGVGMDEYVIENYLLRIGNSYYKSDDFQKERMGMSTDFVPISQFGIGIISCFMIASRIEIITKSTKSHSQTMFFCINDIQGNIYYDRNVPQEESDLVRQGGTVVRILLKEPYASEICNNKISKLWKTYIGHPYSNFYNEYGNILDNSYSIGSENKLCKQYESYNYHLFTILSSFICRYPDNIDVVLESNNNNPSETNLMRQPFALKKGDLGFTLDDAHLLSDNISKYSFEIRWEWCTIYHMDRIQYEDVFFYPIVILPTRNFFIEKKKNRGFYDDFFDQINMDTNVHDGGLPSSYVVGHGITVDGIFVESSKPSITNYGLLDYTGKNKPVLSVDRIKIIQYPDNNDVILETIECLFKQKYQELIAKHVNQYHLDNVTKECVERLHFHIFNSYQKEDSSTIRHLRI